MSWESLEREIRVATPLPQILIQNPIDGDDIAAEQVEVVARVQPFPNNAQYSALVIVNGAARQAQELVAADELLTHGLDEARRQWRWLAASLPQLRSEAGRGEWLVVAAQRFGRVCGSVRWRTLYL